MTDEKILEVIRTLRFKLHAVSSVAPKRASPDFSPTIDGAAIDQNHRNAQWTIAIAHLKWMCDEMLKWDDIVERRAKMNRWVGFVQCGLWILTITPISALKNMNRPDEE